MKLLRGFRPARKHFAFDAIAFFGRARMARRNIR
jgi:hypothetical protein